MNDEYKAVYKQADALRLKFRNYVDQPNNPLAIQLYSGLDRLAEDFERQKGPHSLEDLAKRLIGDIRHVNSQPTVIMDPRHLNELREQLEAIRRSLQKFSNY